MLKRLIPMIAIFVLGLGVQAEEKEETPKCPDDPTEFKGKEDDCFDCLQGAFSKLKEFTDEVSKMLDNKKLTTAEESESLKTRGEGLWDGVSGWQKICEPTPESEEKPKEEGEETKEKVEPEGEAGTEAATEAATEVEGEPKAEEEGGTKAEAETEAKPESEAGPEEASATPEAETEPEPEPDAETQTEGEPEAGA